MQMNQGIKVGFLNLVSILLCTHCGSGAGGSAASQSAAGSSNSNSANQSTCTTNSIDSCWQENYSDLVLYMQFDDRAASSVISHNDTLLETISGLNATAVNADGTKDMSFEAGVVGQSALLTDTAADDYFTVADHADLRLSGSCTISAWVYFNNITGFGVILEKGRNDTDNYGLLINASGKIIFEARDTGGTYRAVTEASAGRVNLSEWTHVAVVFDSASGQLHFYRNGVNIETAAYHYTLDSTVTDDLHIGRQNYASYPYSLDGNIDELAIWKTNLSDAQIQTLYQRQTP